VPCYVIISNIDAVAAFKPQYLLTWSSPFPQLCKLQTDKKDDFVLKWGQTEENVCFIILNLCLTFKVLNYYGSEGDQLWHGGKHTWTDGYPMQNIC